MAQLCKNLTAKTLNSSNVQTLNLSANTLEAQGNKLSQNTLKTSATVRLARPRSVAEVPSLASAFRLRTHN